MSLQFSNTSTKKGIIQELESELDFGDAEISGNTTLLAKFTASINQALDDFISIAIQSSGRWQFDDSNQTDYPVIYTNIVSGQRDYNFTTDQTGNLILDIYKVAILPSATSSVYQSIAPIDEMSRPIDIVGIDYDIVTETTASSTPIAYGKLANGIFLESKPNYSVTRGIKIYINREGSYFTTSDTTKMPGVPGLFHKYFYLKPAREYARRNSLASYERLNEDVVKLEGDERLGVIGEISKYFSKREKDDRNIMIGKRINYI